MKRVLVFGDAIADVYSEYSYKKECPDAPGVSAYVLHSRDVYAGGAANVATNLAVLSPGTKVDLITVVDISLARAIKRASRARVDVTRCMMEDAALVKERVMCDDRQIVRLDSHDRIGTWQAEFLLESLEEYLSKYRPDLVIVSDYAAGSVTSAAVGLLPKERLLVDTKWTDLTPFDGSLLIKLNKEERDRVLQTEPAPERHCQYLVTTLGADGAVLSVRRPHPSQPGRSTTHTLSIRAAVAPEDVVDVCGCGDTFIAGLAASLLANDDPFTAMQFASAAAATVVTQRRTAVANLEETLKMLGRGQQ